jgi:putative transposase
MDISDIDKLPARRSIRLPQFDYSQVGQYFVTICAFQMRCLFGRIEDAESRLSLIGEIAQDCWLQIPRHFPCVTLEPFVIMPNHIHGILTINKDGHGDAVPLHHPEGFQKAAAGSVPTIIRSYKAAVTYRVHADSMRRSIQVWQSNYFERVLLSGKEFLAASRYIVENPKLWHLDKEKRNPQSV